MDLQRTSGDKERLRRDGTWSGAYQGERAEVSLAFPACVGVVLPADELEDVAEEL